MDSWLYQQIGERLRQAREKMGLSQEGLARHLGYSSAATISHFEAGQRKISVIDLLQLADVLGVSPDYLYGESKAAAQMPYFRAKAANVSPTERESVASFLSFVHTHSGPSRVPPEGIGKRRPGQAAEKVLKQVGIAEPPVSPNAVAKHFEVAVFDWDFPDGISGLVVIETGKGSIGVNQNHPNVRQRFTIAHELGHYFLHRQQELFVDFLGTEIAVLTDEEQEKKEREANWFAADLLMPKRWIEADAGKYGPENVTYLAQRYGVSEQALWFRLINLKLVDPTAY